MTMSYMYIIYFDDIHSLTILSYQPPPVSDLLPLSN